MHLAVLKAVQKECKDLKHIRIPDSNIFQAIEPDLHKISHASVSYKEFESSTLKRQLEKDIKLLQKNIDDWVWGKMQDEVVRRIIHLITDAMSVTQMNKEFWGCTDNRIDFACEGIMDRKLHYFYMSCHKYKDINEFWWDINNEIENMDIFWLEHVKRLKKKWFILPHHVDLYGTCIIEMAFKLCVALFYFLDKEIDE